MGFCFQYSNPLFVTLDSGEINHFDRARQRGCRVSQLQSKWILSVLRIKSRCLHDERKKSIRFGHWNSNIIIIFFCLVFMCAKPHSSERTRLSVCGIGQRNENCIGQQNIHRVFMEMNFLFLSLFPLCRQWYNRIGSGETAIENAQKIRF